MSFQRLKDAAKDVLTLEVATMTSTGALKLDRQLDETQKATLETARADLSTANQAVVAAIKAGNDDTAVDLEKEAAKTAAKVLKATEKALGVFDPQNTFARILAQLGDSTNIALVAYSRFEIEGDSVNYISSDDAYSSLVTSHGELVKSSQASRKALFDFVKGLIKGD